MKTREQYKSRGWMWIRIQYLFIALEILSGIFIGPTWVMASLFGLVVVSMCFGIWNIKKSVE